MHACLFDMLHHAADDDILAVGHRIDINFNRIIQKAVEQHRRIIRHLHRLAHITLKVRLPMHDFHRAPAQHIRGAHHQRITDLFRRQQRLGRAAHRAVGRLTQLEAMQQLLESLAVFGHVDGIRRGADDGHAIGFEVTRELKRRLPAKLHNHAQGLFDMHDFQHVFQRQRLKIQTVGGVVIGGHGLRIAIDHNGFKTIFTQRQRRMHAAVIKLNALPNAVGPAAQHHDLFAIGG